MASNICSFNLKEICETTIALIRDPEADLLETLPAPDFQREAISSTTPMKCAKSTRQAEDRSSCAAPLTSNRKERIIEIREIPYTTTIEAIIGRHHRCRQKNKLRDVVNVRDETDLNGLCISVEYKSTSDPDILLHQLFTPDIAPELLLVQFQCAYR